MADPLAAMELSTTAKELLVSHQRVSGFSERGVDLSAIPGNFRGKSGESSEVCQALLPGKFGEILGSPGTFHKRGGA